MTSSTYQAIADIIAEHALLDVGLVKPDTTVDELGLDSLGMVETLFAIEELFDISIPFNASDIENNSFDTSTVATIVAGVEELLSLKDN